MDTNMPPAPQDHDELSTTIVGTGTVTVPPSGDHAVNDTLTVRMVICGIIALVALVIIFSFVLAVKGSSEKMPEPLINIALTLGGGLVGMLASTASRKQ